MKPQDRKTIEICPHCGKPIAEGELWSRHDGCHWHFFCLIEHIGQFHKSEYGPQDKEFWE